MYSPQFLKRSSWFILSIHLLLSCQNANAYDLIGLPASFNFGTVAAPFPDLTLTNNSLCVQPGLLEGGNYYVRATSGNSATTAFQLTNSANSAYKLNYSVSWAGTTTSQSYLALNSGQNSSSSFLALLGTLTCLLGATNATIQLKLLGANQMIAKQGTYTDTLTIIILGA